jgi:hypothetical protein
MSYPATFGAGGREYVLPEIAGWSPPVMHEIVDGRLEPAWTLRVADDPRILDPTLIARDGRFYLFGNDRRTGSNVLSLWSADAIDGEFRLHPANPIRISPRGSRMGGNLVEQGGRLIRLGQDFSRDYGDGLIAFEVTELGPERYSERELGAIRLTDRKGPHTLNFRDGEMVFDWYVDRFAPLAGLRRLAGRRRD